MGNNDEFQERVLGPDGMDELSKGGDSTAKETDEEKAKLRDLLNKQAEEIGRLRQLTEVQLKLANRSLNAQPEPPAKKTEEVTLPDLYADPTGFVNVVRNTIVSDVKGVLSDNSARTAKAVQLTTKFREDHPELVPVEDIVTMFTLQSLKEGFAPEEALEEGIKRTQERLASYQGAKNLKPPPTPRPGSGPSREQPTGGSPTSQMYTEDDQKRALDEELARTTGPQASKKAGLVY